MYTAADSPTLDLSFDLIRSKLHDPDFLNCRGLGGEVPLYICLLYTSPSPRD